MSENTMSAEQVPMAQFTEQAYLNYAMYVILDRALPNIGDGLKPVQRRIIYAMSELGLKSTQKYKKSARTIGDVLGKFHPHGDRACYEAMVLMAQPFSYRYPFVDGQGNWGSPDDPKSFAAMRYTESRLTPYAEALLSEVTQGTVDWQPNFDGTLKEPKVLPARVPNVLLNGGTGIAVGMATDIPPHNLNEIVSACIHLLDEPKATLKDICKHIKGPDFPTVAEIITPKAAILNIYKTGTGSIKMRAVYTIEKGDIVITALPHQASGSKILEQIASQMQQKKLPMVVDLRDESDHENPTRLVIIPKSSRVDLQSVMSHLFATTDLEKNIRVNFNMIGLNGKPQVKGLLAILHEWLTYRVETVRKRSQFQLDKIVDRLHILEGMMIAFLNIDAIIKIIREKDKPKPALIKRFKLSDRQAEAILEIKLRQLAKLEEIKIKTEQEELETEKEKLEKLLSSKRRLRTLVAKELEADAEKFGDKRRTTFVERQEATAIKEEDMISEEPVTVVMSEKGWIRCAKGLEVEGEKLNYKSGDDFLKASGGKSNQQVVFIDTTGRTYALFAHSLPSVRGQGEPLTGRFTPPQGATFTGMLFAEPESQWLLASDAGYGFIATLSDLYVRNKAGKATLKVPENSEVLSPCELSDIKTDKIALVTNEGRLLVYNIKELPLLSKGKGNKLIQIPTARNKARDEYVLSVHVLSKKQSLQVTAGKRKRILTPSNLKDFKGERGQRGRKLPRGYQKVSDVSVID